VCGLENGDAAFYLYPDEESGTIRAKLKEYGIDVEEYEKDGTLRLKSLTEHFMVSGKPDHKKAVDAGLNIWAEAKRKGYKHARSIEDVGDFSFFDGLWQKYLSEWRSLPSMWSA